MTAAADLTHGSLAWLGELDAAELDNLQGQLRAAARRLALPPWLDVDDVVQQALLTMGRPDRPREWAVVDAARELVRQRTPRYGDLRLERVDRSGEICEVPLGDGTRPGGFGEIALRPEAGPDDPVAALKAAFAVEGGWTPAFEAALRFELANHSGFLATGATAHPVTERVRLWVEANPGRPTSQTEIARECRTSRESVTRALAELRRSGAVERVKVASDGRPYRRTAYRPKEECSCVR